MMNEQARHALGAIWDDCYSRDQVSDSARRIMFFQRVASLVEDATGSKVNLYEYQSGIRINRQALGG